MRSTLSGWTTIRIPRSLAELVLYTSLPLILLFLAVVRPSIPFYTLLIAPIALAAVIYEFAGGTLVALVAMAGVAVLIALDPNAARRVLTLQEAWPILSMYLVVGPVIGWLATREREREGYHSRPVRDSWKPDDHSWILYLAGGHRVCCPHDNRHYLENHQNQ
jgi:hypothetical protein